MLCTVELFLCALLQCCELLRRLRNIPRFPLAIGPIPSLTCSEIRAYILRLLATIGNISKNNNQNCISCHNRVHSHSDSPDMHIADKGVDHDGYVFKHDMTTLVGFGVGPLNCLSLVVFSKRPPSLAFLTKSHHTLSNRHKNKSVLRSNGPILADSSYGQLLNLNPRECKQQLIRLYLTSQLNGIMSANS